MKEIPYLQSRQEKKKKETSIRFVGVVGNGDCKGSVMVYWS